jgi:hypothetical protein
VNSAGRYIARQPGQHGSERAHAAHVVFLERADHPMIGGDTPRRSRADPARQHRWISIVKSKICYA